MSERRGGKARDTLEISGLEVEAALGATAAERSAPQKVRVDITLSIDAAPCSASDELRQTVDWARLAGRARRVAAARPRCLAETLASDICAVALAEERVAAAQVRVAKSGARLGGVDALAATIRRKRTRALPPLATRAERAAATLVRAQGSLAKASASVFHALKPRKRWSLPRLSQPLAPGGPATTPGGIPRIVWMTNFTDKCSLPVWANYKRNRRLAPTFEFRFVGDDDADAFVRENASPRALRAWERLEDGAARADFWRVLTLLKIGGVYLDMDAALVRPLERTIGGRDAVYLWDRRRFSNFFMATAPGSPLFGEFFDTIVENIEKTTPQDQPPVFYVTGPGALETVLDGKTGIEYTPHLGCCIQGAFTNERFQYIDRPGSKWTRKTKFVKPV